MIIYSVMFTACDPNGLLDPETARVAVDTGINISKNTSRAVTDGISSFLLRVEGEGMATIEKEFTDEVAVLDIPAGPSRTFTLDALDASDNILFSGRTTETLTAGEIATVNIAMSAAGYYISFDSNGGTEVSSVYVEAGGSIAAPVAPGKSGYSFAGWYADSGLTTFWDFTGDSVAGNTTLYAKWSVIPTYTVTFESNGGSAVSQQYIIQDGTVTAPSEPAKTGYSFAGWYGDIGLTTAWNFSVDTVTDDITIYADWTADSYSITYYLDGGTNNVSNPASYTIEDSTITLADPAKSGYTFGGWFSDAGFSSAVTQIASGSTGAVSLYAKWGYTVSFSSNGGSAVTAQIITEGDYATEPSAPTRNGYTFGGWYVDAGLSSPWTFASDTVTGQTTLYAKWTLITYTISYVLNGGTNGSNPASYTVESSTITLADPTRAGWSFTGWYTDAGFTSQTTSIGSGSTGNRTLYAKWSVTYPGTIAITDDTSLGRGSSYYADYWAVTFASTTSVTVDIMGDNGGLGDTYIYFHDSGSLLASNDDGGEGVNARLTYTFTGGTTYYIEATTYSGGVTGTYVIELSALPSSMYETTRPY